jgi:transcriptional regulator with XRE-family HTH domain
VLTATVRELRESLGLTQQEFAHRLNKAISTVIRYETTREPRGKALIELAEFASANGRADLSRELVGALERELGTGVLLLGAGLSSMDREQVLVDVLRLQKLEWRPAEAMLVRNLFELLLLAIKEMPEGERRDHLAHETSKLLPAIRLCEREIHAFPSPPDAGKDNPRG